jgi:hypothetical protein
MVQEFFGRTDPFFSRPVYCVRPMSLSRIIRDHIFVDTQYVAGPTVSQYCVTRTRPCTGVQQVSYVLSVELLSSHE